MGKIQCHLMTKLIDSNDLDFADTIKSLNPHAIDWSNVPDYLEKKSFIKFAQACSVDDTVHTLHFINWIDYVFGAFHVDWVNSREECMEFYRKMKNAKIASDNDIHEALKDEKSIFSFLNPYHISIS